GRQARPGRLVHLSGERRHGRLAAPEARAGNWPGGGVRVGAPKTLKISVHQGPTKSQIGPAGSTELTCEVKPWSWPPRRPSLGSRPLSLFVQQSYRYGRLPGAAAAGSRDADLS